MVIRRLLQLLRKIIVAAWDGSGVVKDFDGDYLDTFHGDKDDFLSGFSRLHPLFHHTRLELKRYGK